MFQVSQDVSGNGGAPGGEVIGVVVGGKKKGRKNSKGGEGEKKSHYVTGLDRVHELYWRRGGSVE